ncbi:septum site-determining protein MinC [Marinobacterium jannaschii]|uniref:septum site-determining protein MinC n=1 Tax=Marinobacterium jannaschii TaxID=64970 RepID=UPI0004843F6A|nr:septum site-determining protein MinC [Marinobacterium jannaschii]
MNDACFQLKGSAVTAIVLELYRPDSEGFRQQLSAKVEQAPALFEQSPVVISLEKLEGECQPDQLTALIRSCEDVGLKPMALKLTDEQQALASAVSLPRVPLSGSSRSSEASAPQLAAVAEPEVVVERVVEKVVERVVEEKLVQRPSKIISRPVRSGQQVYAEGADLIILAPVSEGAEVLADGSVHVYGPLRGRALAGVKGDTSARIFCQSLEAELVSIAGNFKLSDALHGERWKATAHVSLQDDQLNITPL